MCSFDSYYKGAEAFDSGKSVDDCPSGLTKTQRKLWESGFKNAEKSFKIAEEKEKENAEWENFSSSCPWYVNGCCRALISGRDSSCLKDNCAPLYFMESK